MTQVKHGVDRRQGDSLDIQQEATKVLTQLKADQSLRGFVDATLPIPQPFLGTGDIRLILLGQDPTVKNPASRRRITTVLNLDKPGALKDYLSGICEALALSLDQHVYATNYLKNFFVKPPTQIDEINAFRLFGPMWLPLLREELAEFPQAPIIALGEPLLGALVLGHARRLVREYWGYTPRWKSGETGPFNYVAAENDRLGRTVFPFPHQPSIAKRFYAERLADYTAFVRQEALSR
jgi:hypothetical protein